MQRENPPDLPAVGQNCVLVPVRWYLSESEPCQLRHEAQHLPPLQSEVQASRWQEERKQCPEEGRHARLRLWRLDGRTPAELGMGMKRGSNKAGSLTYFVMEWLISQEEIIAGKGEERKKRAEGWEEEGRLRRSGQSAGRREVPSRSGAAVEWV